MKNVLLLLVIFISASSYRYDVCGMPESLSAHVVLEETAKYGGVGVEPEFDHISMEPRVTFPEDDGRTMQLLKPGANHDQLELNQMVLERLAVIEEPISFVPVVGPYHGYHSCPSKLFYHLQSFQPTTYILYSPLFLFPSLFRVSDSLYSQYFPYWLFQFF